MSKSSVLFIDVGTWEAFNALAGALRKHRVRVGRITAPSHDLAHRAYGLLEGLLYGPTEMLPSATNAAQIAYSAANAGVAAVSGPEPPLDVQAQDGIAHAILLSDAAAAKSMRRSRVDFDQRHLYEKSYMTSLADSLGVPVAREVADPVDSFPVVVKASVGSGGQQVRLATSRQEFADAVDELTTPAGEHPMVQKFYGGGTLHVGAVAVDGELLVAVAYVSEPAADDPQGPPMTVIAVDRPDVIAATRSLANAVGSEGFLCLDFVLDEDGIAYFIDFNPRAFGAWPALQALGADFIGSYLHVLGLGSRPAEPTIHYGKPERLLRFPADDRSWTTLRRWARESTRVIKRSSPSLGWRWASVSAARTVAGAGIACLSIFSR